MKPTAFFAVLFLFALIFAAGFVADNASAGYPCAREQCLCTLYCSSDIGPNCTVPPYYLYEIDCRILPGEGCETCKHFNWDFVGCCARPM